MEAFEKPSPNSPSSSDSGKKDFGNKERGTRFVDDKDLTKLEKEDPAPQDPLDGDDNNGDADLGLHRTHTFHFRAEDDELPEDWWFASTAIPLIAATSGPLANVCSIAALVTSFRCKVTEPRSSVTWQADAIGYPDPHWCIALNIASLVFGCLGNIFLLFNFTQRIRYIIALPATIICWYFATGLLIGITASMNKFVPPGPDEVYSQGFWHAIIAACTYLFSSMLLMINMLGYFLGHYPQHFHLTDDQRNLILQTTMFFIWLAGGGGVFARVCGWSYVDALYFCDVTILTVGFGDYYAPNDTGRGLVFPYAVFGIIILGLMVSSIHSFANELGQDKVIRHHIERKRTLTLDRTVTSSMELERRERDQLEKKMLKNKRITISRPMSARKPTVVSPPPPRESALTFDESKSLERHKDNDGHPHKGPIHTIGRGLKRVATFNSAERDKKKSKLILMREEKDRFDAMRKIQKQTSTFKKWYALSLSVTAFGILWCVGAIGFWKAERSTQNLSYFESLYFCYVSLLTIGYGDLSPKSNAGKPYFIVWSLIAIPTMTVLISDMGDTIIAEFKRGTFVLADWTVLPKKGLYRAVLDKNPWLWRWIQQHAEHHRLKKGMPVGPEEDELPAPTLEELADMRELSGPERAKRLSLAIRKTANDLKHKGNRRYAYEEWVEFTRLIRFTAMPEKDIEVTEDVEGIVRWDWIGDDSPMLAELSESEWVLDRLCESLNRYLKADWREVAQTNRRKSEQPGPVGADLGDEAPLAPPRSENDDVEASAVDFHKPSWDPSRSPAPSSGLSPAWDPSQGPLPSRSKSANRMSTGSRGSNRWDPMSEGGENKGGPGGEFGGAFGADLDETLSPEEPPRARRLSEKEIEDLPGPERRRYRRFGGHAGRGRTGRFNIFRR